MRFSGPTRFAKFSGPTRFAKFSGPGSFSQFSGEDFAKFSGQVSGTTVF